MATTSVPPAIQIEKTAAFAPMLWQQTQAELLTLWRTPSFLISSLTLPLILFALFGATDRSGTVGGVSVKDYVLASFATYGVVSVMLYSFGTRVAVERGQRVNVLMRATPLSPIVSIVAKVLTALIFTLVMLLLLSAYATLFAGIHLDAGRWTDLIARLLLGALPFVALGTAIGYRASPTAAAPITNVLYLLLSFASGIFIPISQLPEFIQRLAPYLPLYHLANLAWIAVGAQTTTTLSDDVRALLIYGVIFAVVAVRAYQSEEQRTFG
jgi:ABC-2 type transport system permease protein